MPTTTAAGIEHFLRFCYVYVVTYGKIEATAVHRLVGSRSLAVKLKSAPESRA